MNINVPIEYWTFRCSLERTGFHTIHAEFHIQIRVSLSTLSRSIEWTWAIRLPDYFHHIQKSTSFMCLYTFVYVINFLKPDQIFTQHLYLHFADIRFESEFEATPAQSHSAFSVFLLFFHHFSSHGCSTVKLSLLEMIINQVGSECPRP